MGKGYNMTVEIIEGMRVLKLRDVSGDQKDALAGDMAMFHIWRLLTGGDTLRDMTVAERRFL